MNRICVLAFIVTTVLSLPSSAVTVSGTVTAINGRPISGVKVYLAEQPALSAYSDAAGHFLLAATVGTRLHADAAVRIPVSIAGSTVRFYSDGSTPVGIALLSADGRTLYASAPRRYDAGFRHHQLPRGIGDGLHLVAVGRGDDRVVIRCAIVGGVIHPMSAAGGVLPANSGTGMAKPAAVMTLKAEFTGYFAYSCAIAGDTAIDIELVKKHLNILAFGASYTQSPQVYQTIAAGIGGSASFLALNGTLSSTAGPLKSFKTDSVNLEADRSQSVRLRDVLHTRNMSTYQSRAGNSAIAAMISTVNAVAQTGGWDVVTLTPHSSVGNRPAVWHDSSVKVMDSLRAHLPGAAVYLVDNPAYRNDCMVMYSINCAHHWFINPSVFDGVTYTGFYTETKHYKNIRSSFATAAARMRVKGIVSTATAFENVRFDAQWGNLPAGGGLDYPDPNYDYVNAKSGDSEPRVTKEIIYGFRWNTDGTWCVDNHPKGAGGALVGLCLVQTVFGQDVRNCTATIINGAAAADVTIMKRIAYQTCAEKLLPDTTRFLEYTP